MAADARIGLTPQADLPNALVALEPVLRDLHERRVRLAVFSDYDGTLTPIVPDPDKATLSEETRAALAELASRHFTALVTGRSTDKIRSFVQLSGARAPYYAASHGQHISGGPDTEGLDLLHPAAQRARPVLEWTHAELVRRLRDVPGFSVEDNVLCISAHYRRVPSDLHARVSSVVDEVLADAMEWPAAGSAGARSAEPAAMTDEALADAIGQLAAPGPGACLAAEGAQLPHSTPPVAGLGTLTELTSGMSVEGSECGDSSGVASAAPAAAGVCSAAASPSATPTPGPLGARPMSSSSSDGQVLLCRREGKMVHELKPEVEWNKGSAVRWLHAQMTARARAEAGAADADDADAAGADDSRPPTRSAADDTGDAEPPVELLPVFIGDDLADEDGFAAVLALHPNALAIKVSARDLAPGAPEPRPTLARYAVEDPLEVTVLLRMLASV